MTILETIIEKNKAVLSVRKEIMPLSMVKAAAQARRSVKDFVGALNRKDRFNVIAELKKASPSKGIIRENFKPDELCLRLENSGAATLSVLTEEFFFQGSLKYLDQVANLVQIPVLRKDFIFDPYQIYEAKAHGADAVLLIAAALDDRAYNELYATAMEAGLAVLSEAHNKEELDRLIRYGAQIVGVNCRDLKTFKTDIVAAEQLLAAIPAGIVKVAESGISAHKDLVRLQAIGVNAFLIGEALMSAPDPGEELKKLLHPGI